MSTEDKILTGYPSIDKPWMKWYGVSETTLGICDNTNVYSKLKQLSSTRGNKTAINYFGRKYSYRELLRKIDETAKAFLLMGVTEKDIVTLSLPNIPENVFCFYALNKIGAVANFIDLRLKGDKLVEAINSTGSEVIVATDLFADELDTIVKRTKLKNVVIASPADSLPLMLKHIYRLKNRKFFMKNIKAICWKNFEKSAKKFDGSFIYHESEEASACILHTSGTTGKPKRVVLTNKVFLEMYIQIANAGLKIYEGDRFLSQVPPFLAYNIVMATNTPLFMGLQILMLPDYQPDKFADNIYKYKPNHVIAGPADWLNFTTNSKMKWRDYSFLVSMISGSDKIESEQKRKVNAVLAECGCKEEILEGYGMTEIAAAAVMNVPAHNVDESVGIPLPKVNVCIYDNEAECELKYEEVGEICMSGPTVMSGYYGDLEETQKVLRKHADGILWLHSGDLGYINQEGNLFSKGRLKRIIIRHDGLKISPYDIEKVLSTHKCVSNCCVVGKSDVVNGNGAVAVAFVTIQEDVHVDNSEIEKELMEICKANLQERYQPKEIHVIGEIPLTSNGKVNYRKLEEMSV